MKIMIVGSMHFAKEMAAIKDKLEKQGHNVGVPLDTLECLENSELKNSFENDLESEIKHCLDRDLLMEGFKQIERSDAILVVNENKNSVEGYIGCSVLMEIGIAFYLGKKIYLLNDIDRSQKYALEVLITKPEIIGGDISKIK